MRFARELELSNDKVIEEEMLVKEIRLLIKMFQDAPSEELLLSINTLTKHLVRQASR